MPGAWQPDARRRKGRGSSTRCRCSTLVASVSRHSPSGLAQGAYEAARGYAFERKQFGQPIGAFQSVRAKLVDAATRIEGCPAC